MKKRTTQLIRLKKKRCLVEAWRLEHSKTVWRIIEWTKNMSANISLCRPAEVLASLRTAKQENGEQRFLWFQTCSTPTLREAMGSSGMIWTWRWNTESGSEGWRTAQTGLLRKGTVTSLWKAPKSCRLGKWWVLRRWRDLAEMTRSSETRPGSRTKSEP